MSILIGVISSIIASILFYLFFEKKMLIKIQILKISKYFNCDFVFGNPCFNACEMYYDICDFQNFLEAYVKKHSNKSRKELLKNLKEFLEKYKQNFVPPYDWKDNTTYFGSYYLHGINENNRENSLRADLNKINNIIKNNL